MSTIYGDATCPSCYPNLPDEVRCYERVGHPGLHRGSVSFAWTDSEAYASESRTIDSATYWETPGDADKR